MKRDKEKAKTSFTLIELMVVVIIVGILAAIGLPHYVRSQERAIDKQAQAILSTIRAAERSYRLDTGVYWGTPSGISDINQINSNLGLDLVNDGTWNYTIQSSGGGFAAELRRDAGGYGRRWIITHLMDQPGCWYIGGGQCQ